MTKSLRIENRFHPNSNPILFTLFMPETDYHTKIYKENGGGERVRTDDLLLAKQVLSQLSYAPDKILVGLGRFELPTSRLSGVRSNQLSYRP